MATTEEDLKQILLTENPDVAAMNTDSLEQIASTQKQLSQVKESLGTIIDTIAQNQSLVTRAATYWGELPLWQRVAGGVVLTVPTLAAGLVVAHVGMLMAISGVTAAAYAAGGAVLDDHHNYNVNVIDRLKEGIFSLADVLEITISALETIRYKLAEELEKFKLQNELLTDKICVLGDQIDSLSHQVDVFIETEKLLRNAKEELEKTTEALRESVDQQNDLLLAQQKQLDLVKKAYEKSQTQLSEKVVELCTVRLSMGLEVDKAKKIAATLEGTVKTLAGSVIDDGTQRQAFQDRLKTFLTDKEASFDQVAKRIGETESELATVKEELKRGNERYQELLNRQEKQVIRLERLDQHIVTERLIPSVHLSELLSKSGFYAQKTTIGTPSEAAKQVLVG